MARDEDDWVGEPPEGRYTRDRAKPEFWRSQRPVQAVAGTMIVILIVVLLVLILH